MCGTPLLCCGGYAGVVGSSPPTRPQPAVGAPEVEVHHRFNLVDVGRLFGSVSLPAVDEEGRNLLRLRPSC